MQSPFEPWLKGSQPLPSRFYAERVADLVTADWLCWVTPLQRVPLHLATTLEWLSLADSRTKSQGYLQEASKIVTGLEGAWLDGWEREKMAESSLAPPPFCYPIYLITCEDAAAEQIVYVGQTSVSNRFSGGHAAALKLHDPKYAVYKKWVYQCSVCLLQDKEYLFLEWLDPIETAIAVLDDVESQMIFDLQPDLNKSKRKKQSAKTPLYVCIQHSMPESRLK